MSNIQCSYLYEVESRLNSAYKSSQLCRKIIRSTVSSIQGHKTSKRKDYITLQYLLSEIYTTIENNIFIEYTSFFHVFIFYLLTHSLTYTVSPSSLHNIPHFTPPLFFHSFLRVSSIWFIPLTIHHFSKHEYHHSTNPSAYHSSHLLFLPLFFMYRIIPFTNPILSIWTHSSTALTASHIPMPPLPPSCRVTYYVLVSCPWLGFIMVVYIFSSSTRFFEHWSPFH